MTAGHVVGIQSELQHNKLQCPKTQFNIKYAGLILSTDKVRFYISGLKFTVGSHTYQLIQSLTSV